MNSRLLMAVSILAIGVSSAAFAEQYSGNQPNNNTTQQTARAPSPSSTDLRQEAFRAPVENPRYNAASLIGYDVKNNKGERVARVKDIVLSPEGRAVLLVLSDNGPLGLEGKDVAYEYSSLVNSNAQGEVLLPLSETLISQAIPYSPDANNQGFSTASMLKSKLEDPMGKTIADIENITFEDGHAQTMIVSFDKVMGLGGKKAAVNFSDLHLLHKNNKRVSARMNRDQSAAYDPSVDNVR